MNTSGEEPAPKQPIFVLGVERSGTILVQRLLNSYDDVILWGEHHGMLAPLAESFFRTLEGKPPEPPHLALRRRVDWRRLTPDSQGWSVQAWLNWFEPADLIACYRRFGESLFMPDGVPGKQFWGFKEVRYGPKDRVLDFLATLFPEAIFVFVIRNAFDALASWRANRRHAGLDARWLNCYTSCEHWREANNTFWRWHKSGKIQSYWIVFKDLIARKGDIHRLLDAMGKCFGDRQREILESRLGRGSSFEDGDVLGRWKTLPWHWHSLAHELVGSANQQFGFENPPLSAFSRLCGKMLRLVLFGFRVFSRCAAVFRKRLRRHSRSDGRVDGPDNENFDKSAGTPGLALEGEPSRGA